jgi:LPXTG-motif cell wall-anchored protein
MVPRMAPRRTLPALVAALALGVSAPALAQSAGDEQYQDPFGGGDSGGETTPPPSAPSTPSAPAPAPAAPAPASGPTATTAQSTPSASSRSELPYTGSPVGAGLLAGVGGLLLAGGLTLRVRLRERDGA